MTSDQPDDSRYLRGLAARLRSLAMIEPVIADELRHIADRTEDHADALAPWSRPRTP